MARFYFAFVTSADKTFSNSFKRNDADVFSFELVHEEGQFARLDVEIKNPKVGLLSPNRKQWCWLSYENGQTFSQLFFGRMVGAPQEIDKEIVKLSFVAKPADFNAQKIALANSLKTLPEFDPVWISPEERDNPETVLESRPLLWHIDRKTHTVTASNINSGEDGVINLGTDFYYDSLQIGYGSPPLTQIDVEGNVSWTEKVSGIFDISSNFPRPLKTLTGTELLETWPSYGTDIGGNWKIDVANIRRADGSAFPSSYETFVNPTTNTSIAFPVYSLIITQKVSYQADRERSETVKFSVKADNQEIFSDSGDESIETFSVSSNEIDKPIDGQNIPLNIKRTYFKTERGRKSLEYLLAVAKTKLLSRARAVNILAETSFENGLAFSCRKDVALEDLRISTGAAIGKITSYTLYCNGDSGSLGTRFTIGCTIGRGEATVVSTGSPTYADNYVSGYQYYSGAQFEALVGGAAYGDYSNQSINDDGLDFSQYTKSQALKNLTVINPYSVQKTKIKNNVSTQENIDRINQFFTQISLTMNAISEGPFDTTYNISVSDFSIPKTVDLEI